MIRELWESFTDALEGLGAVVHFLFRLVGQYAARIAAIRA